MNATQSNSASLKTQVTPRQNQQDQQKNQDNCTACSGDKGCCSKDQIQDITKADLETIMTHLNIKNKSQNEPSPSSLGGLDVPVSTLPTSATEIITLMESLGIDTSQYKELPTINDILP